MNSQSFERSGTFGLARWSICFAVAMVDGYDTLMLSFIAPLLARDWHLKPAAIGAIFSATYLGAAVGASVFGALADLHGRRRLLVWALLIGGGFGLSCAFAQNPGALALLRALSGVGLGAAIPIVSALAGEVAPAGRRGEAVTRVFVGYPIGALLGGALTAALMNRMGWRGIFLSAGTITLLLAGVAMLMLPKMSGARAVDPPQLRPFKVLLSRQDRLKTGIVCSVTFLLLLVSYFLVSWMPLVLSSWGMDVHLAALSSVLLNVGGVLGGYALALMSTRAPVRAMAGTLVGGSVAIGLLGLLASSGTALTLGWTTLIGLCVIGAQINVPALTAQLYPKSSSATAVGAAMAAGRLGSIAGPVLAGLLLSRAIGWGTLFALAAIPPLIAALLLFCLRAAGQDRSLEEP